MEFNKRDLDRYITGNYGEDQFRHHEDDDILCAYCGEDPPTVGGEFCSKGCELAFKAEQTEEEHWRNFDSQE